MFAESKGQELFYGTDEFNRYGGLTEFCARFKAADG